MTETEQMEDTLLERICVSRPYFALTDMSANVEGLTASVRREQPLDCEAGPMKAGEIGRHLAVLGACTLANANTSPDRHYYLAHRAHLKRRTSDFSSHMNTFEARAALCMFDGRKALTRAQLAGADGPALYELNVHYHVLHERSFQRLFAGYRQNAPHTSFIDTHYERPTPFVLRAMNKVSLSGYIGPVRAEDCPGHFDGYPSIPASVLMGTLIDCAGRLLSKHIGVDRVRYSVIEALVEAANLAPIGQRIEIGVALVRATDGSNYRFECKADTEGGMNVGRLTLELELVIG